MDDAREKGAATKWASQAALLAWMGLGPAELIPGATSGSEAAQGRYEGWGRDFVELHLHPACQSIQHRAGASQLSLDCPSR